MFQQTYFYPSTKQHKRQRCKSEDDFAAWAGAATAAPSTAEKTSSFMDLRKDFFGERFGVSSSSASTPTNSGHCRNSVFHQSSTPVKGSTNTAAPNRFGSYPLAPNLVAALMPTTSPLFSSPEQHDHATRTTTGVDRGGPKQLSAYSDADTATTGSISIATSISSPTPSMLSNISSLDGDGEVDDAIRVVLDNTEALPDWIANAGHRGSEDEEDQDATDTHWEESRTRGANPSARDREYEYEEFEDDICSCCTPVLDNTSRPQQAFRQQQQQQAFASRRRSSMMTTTTTETTTTTTTTMKSRTASAMEASQSVVSSANIPQPSSPFRSPNPLSKPNEDHFSSVGTLNHEGDNITSMVPLHERETNSAIATTRTSAVAARLPSCGSCASKQRKIERQREELRQMKAAVSRLVLMLADAVRPKQEIEDDSNLLADSREPPKPKAITDGSHNTNNIAPATPVSCGNSKSSVIGNKPELKVISDGSSNNVIVPATPVSCGTSGTPKPKLITDGSHNNSIVPATPVSCGTSKASKRGNKNKNDEASSEATSAAAASSSVPSSTLPRRRIINMPITSVSNDCPRTKKQRILVNGRWGTYSGPTPNGKVENKIKCDAKAEKETGKTESDHKSNGKIENDESKTDTISSGDESSPEAGIFQGCVVRLDEGELYVGSLSRNDTGSFTFHPPGTLYDRNRKPIRRIR